jgi:GTP-binding protein LepA
VATCLPADRLAFGQKNSMNISHIRNFAIIAHIDHGKSTLADRMLEITGTVSRGNHEEQLLDRNPISRERGITIKLSPVRMKYTYEGAEYLLNLIDTPGHVDFSYEVDRTLASVEGVILLVDATQGIQAQTISNAYKALDKNLTIIPVINKIDLPNAEVEKTTMQLQSFLGIKPEEIFHISAKTGMNVQEVLNAVVTQIHPPESNPASTLCQSLIFDSYYDTHKGVIAFVRLFNGSIKKGTKQRLAVNGTVFDTPEVGIFTPDLVPTDSLNAGDIGYIVTNQKDIHQVHVGDTLIDEKGISPPLPGYKRVKPMVFASMFTTDTADYLNLKKALDKLYLNDSSLEFNAIYSKALGAGFRVGLLGLLHADVVRERLEREFDLSIVLTPPQVEYVVENGMYQEPYVKIMIITPEEYMGAVMQLCESYRGQFLTMDNKDQISLTYELPLSEMISDFFDNLKSATSGYASLDWEFLKYVPVTADKMSILLNLEEVDEFSEIVVQERAYEKGSELTSKLKELIPRQQFEVKIQAKFKGKIIASSTVSAFRKDVTAKLYGGDRTRKDKLLKKQKAGKKRMKMIGSVEIPKEAFLKLFNKKA